MMKSLALPMGRSLLMFTAEGDWLVFIFKPTIPKNVSAMKTTDLVNPIFRMIKGFIIMTSPPTPQALHKTTPISFLISGAYCSEAQMTKLLSAPVAMIVIGQLLEAT
jgi:hypothetical protein